MNCWHFLVSFGEDLSPTEVVRRLRKVFPLVHVNFHVGGYRVGQRIRRFRTLNAPDVVLQLEERAQKEALQVSVFDGEPLVEVLDLTVRRGSIQAYHRPGADDLVRRVATALVYEVEEADGSEDDERDSLEEKRHRARVRKTRDTMTALRDRFEGAEGLFVSGSHVSRVRVHDLQLTEPHFAASVDLLPTRGLWNDMRSFRLTWWWDEFSCGPEVWARGPIIVETFQFGDHVEAVVRYGESLADPEYTSERRREVGKVALAHRRAVLEPYCQADLELFWKGTRIGVVTGHSLDAFPQVRGRLEVADLSSELRAALEWWARDADLDEVAEQPFPDEWVEDWWLRAADGTRLEASWMPTVNFGEQTIEWFYSHRTPARNF
jgi:hypothetical protein